MANVYHLGRGDYRTLLPLLKILLYNSVELIKGMYCNMLYDYLLVISKGTNELKLESGFSEKA